MDVTLHFGAHRTGTTTFQRMMGQSGPSLREAQLAYWGPKRTRSTLFDGLLGPAAGIFPWSGRKSNRALGRVQLAMQTVAQSGVQHLLISEENMVGTLRQTLDTGKLYPDARGRAGRLASVFGESCIQIGFGIRSYDEWWASAVAFSVLKAGPVPSRDLCEALVAQPRRWRHVIADLAEGFPDAQLYVWTHEALAARPEIVARALLGNDLPRLSGTRDWHNTSPSPAAMRCHLSDLGQPSTGVVEVAGKFMPFTPEERHILQTHYAEDIAWLRDTAGPAITYIDDLGQDPGAPGHGEGNPDEGRDTDTQRLA